MQLTAYAIQGVATSPSPKQQPQTTQQSPHRPTGIDGGGQFLF